MRQIVCAECSKVFEHWNARTRFCSPKCRQSDVKRRHQAINPSHGRSSGTTGAMSELVVAVDLMRRGYDVFRAMSPSCPCDLMVIAPGVVMRVEVRTGNRTPGGRLCYPLRQRDIGRHDVLAVAEHNGSITYIPDIPVLERAKTTSRKIDSFGGVHAGEVGR